MIFLQHFDTLIVESGQVIQQKVVGDLAQTTVIESTLRQVPF